MATQYPGAIDTLITLPKVFDNISPVVAADVNRLRDAAVQIQLELGSNPSGTFGTVRDRLNSLDLGIDGLLDAIDSLTASDIAVLDIDGYFEGTSVESVLAELYVFLTEALSASGIIGEAEDGTYEDGIFKDFTPETPVGTAIDRFNELLAGLAPAPAPDLMNITYSTTSGPAGHVSFGASNPIPGYTSVGNASGESILDAGGLFPNNSAARRGVYAASGTIAGVLAGAVGADTSTPTPSYPAQSFGRADQGELRLYFNGASAHTVDLSTFASGVTAGSGPRFDLSAATPNKFPLGSDFDLFKYRTGTWEIDSASQVLGYNYVQVRHVIGATILSTNHFEWVNDGSTTDTTYAGESLTSLSLTGSKRLSGIEYYTAGTAAYNLAISNAYRNTYSSSASAISHGSSVNCSLVASVIPAITSPDYEDSAVTLSSKLATITSAKLFNQGITARTTTDRTIQSDLTSTGATQDFILLDSSANTSTATAEFFGGEQYRVPSDRDITDTTGFTAPGASLWSNTESLVGADAGHNNGLLQYNNLLVYPSAVSIVNSGNFSTIINGPINPNYSTVADARVYLRYFYYAAATQNFILTLVGSGITVKSLSSALVSSSGDVHIELLASNTTSNGVTTEYKDITVAYTSDNAIGCHAATYGATAYSSWGLTLGTKSTATSGNAVILRVTVPELWTGSLSQLSLVGA